MSNEFLTGLQAASNAVAGNVAGPVDILSLLLRKAGLPVPENAVGGSNWMTQKGLMAPVRQGASQVIGETAGLLGPAMVSQFGPQIARGLLKGGENLAAPRTLNPQTGAVVYHGSPHKFDKFDSSKIGTGEGAQAYGHGLYLAESPDVAKTYMGAGKSIGGPAFENKLVKLMEKAQDAGRYGEAGALEDLLINRNPAMAYSKYSVGNGYSPETVAQAHKIIKQFEDKFQPAGLYKVDLPDEKIARMLDWDAPLSQQAPEVQKHFEPLVAPIRAEMAKPANPGWGDLAAPTNFDPTGQELLGLMRNRDAELTAQSFLANGLGDDVSRTLRAQGIPGIRYLDGSSRTAGQGTRNYVVFPGEESSLRILERNGQGLLGP